MLAEVILFYAVVLVVLAVLRVLWVLRVEAPATVPLAVTERPLRICVVLGSGGHTSEMFGTLRALPEGVWAKHTPYYVIADTDRDSEAVAVKFESETCRRPAICFRLPRAREVGQSYISSIWSTLRGVFAAVRLLLGSRASNHLGKSVGSGGYPDVILTNGPGVCIPIIVANVLIAAVLFRRRAAMAYFESFTCVDHLSLSGKLLLPVVDIFTVQWRSLLSTLKQHSGVLGPRGTGSLWFCGPDLESQDLPAIWSEPTEGAAWIPPAQRKPLAVVTVGSTQFDRLMAYIDHPSFLAALERLEISECIIQKGRSSYPFQCLHQQDHHAPVRCTIVDYKPFLQDDIAEASLVISHAGAGTILEALKAHTPLVVVPNERLMSNHQLQLARSLADFGFLFVLNLPANVRGETGDMLRFVELSKLKAFPGPNRAMTAEVFRRVTRRS